MCGAARSERPIMQPRVASIPSYSDVSAQPPRPVAARRYSSPSTELVSSAAVPIPGARTSTKIGPGRCPASWVQNPVLASTSRPKSATVPQPARLGRQRAYTTAGFTALTSR